MTKIRLMQAILGGAAAAATLALFNAGPSDAQTSVAAPAATSSGAASRIIPVNDDDVFNPSDGDIFTQNAQDQSTASGAGT
jgi:hypothetical protein